MSRLSDIVAQLESGGGRSIASQPASMVNPLYGQYGGFASQYGSGAAGVDNYAAKTLAANPNATLGDFYAGYVLGTGTPGAYHTADLASTTVPGAQGAYNNLVNNAGVPASTPLAQLVADPGSSIGPGGDTLTIDPGTIDPGSGSYTPPGFSSDGSIPTFGAQPSLIDPATGYPYTDFSGGTTGPGGLDIGPFTSAEGLFGPSAPNPVPGTAGAGTGLGGIFTAAGNWLVRFGLILLGVVLVGVAAWATARGEFGAGPQRALAKV